MRLTHLLLTGTILCTYPAQAFSASPEEMEERLKQMEAKLAKFETMMENVDQYIEQQVDQRVEEELAKATYEKSAEIDRIVAKKVETQMKKQVEAEIAEQVAAVQPAAGHDQPSKFGKGYIDIPGTDSAVKFGAYVKVDASYDIGKAYGNDFVSFGGIPLDNSQNDNQDGEFNMNVRQTRINMTTMTDTEMGDLKVFVEGDFFGTAGTQTTTNSHGFRLRHAYGELGNWMVGQNWSTFQDTGVYPGSLDLIGGVGTTHLRQPQIRYTGKISDQTSLAVAIENPSGDINDSSSSSIVTEQFPDVTAALTHKSDWGHVSLRGMAREIHVQDTVTANEEDEFGWGLSVSGKVKLGEKDSIFGRYAGGDGIGRYLFDVAGNGAAYTTDQLETQTAHGGHATYRHYWTDNLSSNLIGGYVSIDNDTNIVGTAVNESIYSAHANLIWQPVEKVKVGVEYMHGERELENGTEGDLDRVLTSFIYSF